MNELEYRLAEIIAASARLRGVILMRKPTSDQPIRTTKSRRNRKHV